MVLLIPFLFFAVLNAGTVVLSRRKFGMALPVTLMASALLVYYGQMIFRTFRVGYAVLGLLAAASVIACIRGRKDPDLKQRIFSNGFYCYLALCVFILVIDSFPVPGHNR